MHNARVDRAGFLKRLGLAGAALSLPKIPQSLAKPLPVEGLPAVVAPIKAFPPVTGELLASGGLCTPVTPYYDLEYVSAHALRDALPAFRADRGGIRYKRPGLVTFTEDWLTE